MKKILTAPLAVALVLAPASAYAQGVITYHQSYETGSTPGPGRYKVVKIKKARAAHHKHSYKVAKASPGAGTVAKVAKVKKTKAVHHKHSHKVAKASPGAGTVAKIAKATTTKAVHHKRLYKVAKAPHYAKHSYYRPGHHHHWDGHQHWLLPALVGRILGLGLFHYWR